MGAAGKKQAPNPFAGAVPAVSLPVPPLFPGWIVSNQM
jgi:hypothetical protein